MDVNKMTLYVDDSKADIYKILKLVDIEKITIPKSF